MNVRMAMVVLNVAAVLGSGCATPSMVKESAEAQRQIVQELRLMNATLTDLAATMKSNPAPRSVTRVSSYQSQGPDREALLKIKLPDPLTKEGARAYVTEILALSSGQNSFSDRDPQVGLLARVGEDNLDVLLEYTGSSGMIDYHLNKAIQRVATDRSKQLILDRLDKNMELANVVFKRGWAEDARATLMEGLKSDRVPGEWISAVASLRDTNTYPVLLNYFVQGQNRVQTYELIKSLPGIDLATSVATAWERSRFGHRWEVNGMAVVAVGYGHTNALEAIIRAVQAPDIQENSYEINQLLTALWEHTDGAGSPKEMAAWYEANKANLVFDATTRRFRKGM